MNSVRALFINKLLNSETTIGKGAWRRGSEAGRGAEEAVGKEGFEGLEAYCRKCR